MKIFLYILFCLSEDGLITLDEFERLRCVINTDPERVLRWAFNKFDSNNDGTIDKAELKYVAYFLAYLYVSRTVNYDDYVRMKMSIPS